MPEKHFHHSTARRILTSLISGLATSVPFTRTCAAKAIRKDTSVVKGHIHPPEQSAGPRQHGQTARLRCSWTRLHAPPSGWPFKQVKRSPVRGVTRRDFRLVGLFSALIALALAASACSIKRTAVDIVGNAISGGSSVYASDDDPDLVREAIPFGLKTYESLLAVSPEHQGLLLASAKGFVIYAYLLGQDANRLEATDVPGARALGARITKLFLRGRDYAMRGLEVAHPGFTARFTRDSAAALAMTKKADTDFLYWAGAGWSGAIGANKSDPRLIGDLPSAGALVGRVLQIDETYDGGAAEEFFITYEGSRPGGSEKAARLHYQRALALSNGNRASVYLTLAEAVSVREQNLPEFRSLIRAALAVDPDRVPEFRLVNTLAIRRAHWLEQRIPELFVSGGLTE